jgi:3-mercaptopyruvate sulfurtransferase SseA
MDESNHTQTAPACAQGEREQARSILFAYGDKNEATAHPWWAVVYKNGMGARAIAAGPFFSRERAERHLEARRYEYGRGAIVYCFSGHRSQHYVDLREALTPEDRP